MSCARKHDPTGDPGRPTVVSVDLARLRDNFRAIRNFVTPAKVMGVVKANAYGHGLIEASKVLEQEGIDSLAVAFIEEAVVLRRNGITVPILVLGGLPKEQIALHIRHQVDLTASSVDLLHAIDDTARHLGQQARVHLKIDTGLERVGVHYYAATELYDAALRAKHIVVVGVYSHFVDVDPLDPVPARQQLERFLESLRYFEGRAHGPFARHIASTGGLLRLPESHLDLVRPGLGLYGVYPSPGLEQILPLEAVLSLTTQVVYSKITRQGAGVSYGHRWTAPNDTRIATLPLGYGDGLLRQLSQKFDVLIRGRRCPQVGVICMDQLMVNVGAGDAECGDEVVLIGSQGGEHISVEELAAAIQTTPHDIVVSLNQRIPRRYVGSVV